MSHSVSISISLKTRLVVYRLNSHDFSVDLELTHHDSFTSVLGRVLASGASRDLAVEATKDVAEELFETAVSLAFLDS